MKYTRGRRRLPDGEKGTTSLVRYDRGANKKWGAAEDHSPKGDSHNYDQTTSIILTLTCYRLWYAWSMKPRHVVLYARVSTKDKGQDTENQLAQLRDFCRK
jgi:hypothetical protein